MSQTSSARVLVVDDDVSNIEVVHGVLAPDYDILFATTGRQALSVAVRSVPDLILLDVMMPGMDGYQVCVALKDGPGTKSIPVIFLTGLGDDVAEARALELGAVDYVTKPISPVVLRSRVRNQIELQRSRAVLQQLAITDGLTGLANRREFDAVLEREFRRLSRSGEPLSLLMCDVDHFKGYNDRYGHVAGDDCLRDVAAVLGCMASRAADHVARYGGEEFAAILPETHFAGAMVVAERFCAAIAGRQIPHEASQVASHVTVSIGVVTTRCSEQTSTGTVIGVADQALYRAKAAGRNCVVGANLWNDDAYRRPQLTSNVASCQVDREKLQVRIE